MSLQAEPETHSQNPEQPNSIPAEQNDAVPYLSPQMRDFVDALFQGKTPIEAVGAAYAFKGATNRKRKARLLMAHPAVRQALQERGWKDPAETPVVDTDRARLELIRDSAMEVLRKNGATAAEKASSAKVARDAMRDLQGLAQERQTGEYPELVGFVESCKRGKLLNIHTVDRPNTSHNGVNAPQPL